MLSSDMQTSNILLFWSCIHKRATEESTAENHVEQMMASVSSFHSLQSPSWISTPKAHGTEIQFGSVLSLKLLSSVQIRKEENNNSECFPLTDPSFIYYT